MEQPRISAVRNGPLVVKDIEDIRDEIGNPFKSMPVMSLCRCGESGSKPYCDGSHTNGYSSAPSKEGKKEPRHHVGEEVTIHFHEKVCSRAGHCGRDLPEVFSHGIDPDEAIPEKVIEIIKKCPSGALSCTYKEKHIKDFDRAPTIIISRDGPINTEGNIKFEEGEGHKPISKEHYSLCRCGGSSNKPYCDGAHIENGFKG